MDWLAADLVAGDNWCFCVPGLEIGECSGAVVGVEGRYVE